MLILTLATLLVGVLGGCGGAAQDSEAAPEAKTPSASEADQQKPESPNTENADADEAKAEGSDSQADSAAPSEEPKKRPEDSRCAAITVKNALQENVRMALYADRGNAKCDDAKRLISQYWKDAPTQGGGNTLALEIDGWLCSSPTASMSQEQSVITMCENQGDSGVVSGRPLELSIPAGEHVGVAKMMDYLGGTSTNAQTYYFQSPEGNYECAISAATGSGSGTIAGCHGDFPEDRPKVPGLMDGPATKGNSIQVIAGSKGSFVNSGDPKFRSFEKKATILEYNAVLIAYGVACTVEEKAGVTCLAGENGFSVSPSGYLLF